MTASVQKLGQLVQFLEESGGPAERLHLARCALSFKRSWVELAAGLKHLQDSGGFRAWGHDDLMTYCTGELGLRAATVDKLLVSYATVHKHAPAYLEGGESATIPSYQSLDYFARATGEPRADGSTPRRVPTEVPEGQLLERLRGAVFDDQLSAGQLRREFDPLLYPRSPTEQQLLALRRAATTAQRLTEQLEELEELEGLEDKRLQRLQGELDRLRTELETRVAELQQSAAA